MIFWLFSGWDQKAGLLISSSSLSSWLLRVGASKIAPHSVGLLAERRVFSFEFFESHYTTTIAILGFVEKAL
jgi:hypothetical protein